MTIDVRIWVCEGFAAAARAAVSGDAEFAGVEICAFPRRCGRPPLAMAELTGADPGTKSNPLPTGLIGSACVAQLAQEHQQTDQILVEHLGNCFSLFADPDLIDRLVAGGAYLVTGDWLANHERHLARQGFDRSSARAMFAEAISRVVWLDTGCDPAGHEHLAQFAAFVDRPAERHPVGRHWCRLQLRSLVRRLRHARDLHAQRAATDEARRRQAEAQMLLDLLADVSSIGHGPSGASAQATEPTLVPRLLEVFVSLFAPAGVYLVWREGAAGSAQDRLHAHGTPPPTALEFARALLNESNTHRLFPEDNGFIVRIRRGDLDIGALGIHQIAFPQYLRDYLSLTLAAAPVLALALDNARIYNELLQKNQDIVTANRQLVAASAAKSDFFATMSHEFRTPLNGILGATELLLASRGATTRTDLVEIIRTSSQLLNNVIEDILDFSRLESKRCTLDEAPFDLHLLCDEVSEVVAVRAHRKQVHVVLQVSSTVPRRVVGDAQRLHRILLNLAGNAVKFTAKGCVIVRLQATPSDNGRCTLAVEISDTGIGIAPEHIGRLFSPFTQVDSSITRRFGGTGLGLAISRELVELMGGQIGVTSEPGQGSCFRFTIDLRPEPAPTPDVSPEQPVPQVLLVDPHGPSRDAYAAAFAERGCRVSVFTSYVDLARHLGGRSESPEADVVVVGLDFVDGGEALVYEAVRWCSHFGRPRLVLAVPLSRRVDTPADFAPGQVVIVGKPLRTTNIEMLLGRTRTKTPAAPAPPLPTL